VTLKISPGLELPLEAVTETFAILAVKRAGKSNAAVAMAEEMYDAGVPWVAVDPKGDWWGVRAAGDGQAPGLSVLVFGGMHGDIPLEPTAGRLVADLIAEQRITCVLDVSEMSKADQRRFLTDFADRLYRRNTEPLHVFCEEADEYIPQRVLGEAAKLVSAFETLVKRGGFRGIGVTLITQRSASLNKDVLTQAGTLIAMRTPSPQDRKAVLAWIDYHAASRDVIDELPTLEAGEAWVFSPQWLKTLTKIRFRRRRTFDSGATPKVGGKPKPPTTLADVDLAAIKEQMAETIEKAKAEDPKLLRKRIAELEAKVRELEAATPEPIVEQISVPVLDEALVLRLEELLEPITGVLGDVQEKLRWHTESNGDVITFERRAKTPTPPSPPRPAPPVKQVPRRREPTGDITLKAGARRMVEIAARYEPRKLTRDEMSTLSHVARGGTLSDYVRSIVNEGLIVEASDGITLTAAGRDFAGNIDGPYSCADVVAMYAGDLKAGARRMLDLLVDCYPNGMTRNELSEQAEVAKGGTLSDYVRSMTKCGLAVERSGVVYASETLFFGGR
jgi:hypothetical protein